MSKKNIFIPRPRRLVRVWYSANDLGNSLVSRWIETDVAKPRENSSDLSSDATGGLCLCT